MFLIIRLFDRRFSSVCSLYARRDSFRFWTYIRRASRRPFQYVWNDAHQFLRLSRRILRRI